MLSKLLNTGISCKAGNETSVLARGVGQMRNKLANQKLKLQQQKRSESIYFYQMANANTNTIALFNLQTKQENDYSFLDNILLCQNKINAKIVSVIINTVHSIQRALVGSIQFLPIQETCKKCVGNREEEVNKTFPFCYSFSSLSLFVKHRLSQTLPQQIGRRTRSFILSPS